MLTPHIYNLNQLYILLGLAALHTCRLYMWEVMFIEPKRTPQGDAAGQDLK